MSQREKINKFMPCFSMVKKNKRILVMILIFIVFYWPWLTQRNKSWRWHSMEVTLALAGGAVRTVHVHPSSEGYKTRVRQA